MVSAMHTTTTLCEIERKLTENELMLFAVQMVERSAVMVIAGARLGKVISVKRRKTLAPCHYRKGARKR